MSEITLQDLVFIGVFVVFLAPGLLWMVWRHRRASRNLMANERLSKGYCPQCAYDFAGRANPQCPECGYMFTPREYEKLESIQQVLQKVRSQS